MLQKGREDHGDPLDPVDKTDEIEYSMATLAQLNTNSMTVIISYYSIDHISKQVEV